MRIALIASLPLVGVISATTLVLRTIFFLGSSRSYYALHMRNLYRIDYVPALVGVISATTLVLRENYALHMRNPRASSGLEKSAASNN